MTKRNTPGVKTFGCRLNIWETEVLREQAGAAGLSDAIIFNTCAVTAEAEKQARQRKAVVTIQMPESLSPDVPHRLLPRLGLTCPKLLKCLATMTS